MTGDLIGTLRYMSPEQALAKHGLVDHRTDVYSLGATLYELLTLRPAVDGADKQEILQADRVRGADAAAQLDKSIPGGVGDDHAQGAWRRTRGSGTRRRASSRTICGGGWAIRRSRRSRRGCCKRWASGRGGIGASR